nr:immunoglobulin light chain junction region [Macaca mulatta]
CQQHGHWPQPTF